MSAAVDAAARAMPVAIVGIGCRFPGGVVDADSFWQLLADGVDAITEIPSDRFNIGAYYDEKPATPGKVMSKWGGFITQRFDEFDADFFGISRTYAERLDPQQRLLLETAWEALEDAGQDVTALQGSRTGVFIGQWLSDFEHRLFADHAGIDFAMTLGSGRYAVPGRLSYAFGFRGPSLSLDAGCSAGLASVHLAVQSLRSGESTMALAGGVNVILQPHIHVAYSQSRMMAPDGRCKFGDARGDGYVRAEGVGIVVLKPLDRALADGDRVYAVIRGSAVNNDGDSSGSMGTPSRVGQEELVRTALRDAQVAPADVTYVEAHGTGTRAGDPVELGVLASVLSEGRAPGSTAWVGSVKTNIGHTEATAGIAGLIKGALMLQRGMIPPSLHHREPNPGIAWGEVPVAIPTALMPWPTGTARRVVGVSSFGIGGTNAHVVLEAAGSATPVIGSRPSTAPLLLPLSGRSDAAVRALATRYAERLDMAEAQGAADLCFSAATSRTALSHRAAFVAADRAAMVAALRGFVAGDAATADGIVHDRAPRRLAFVVPGQGAQWTGMARQFYAQEPVFRDALDACDAAARAAVEWSIIEQLHLEEHDPQYRGARIDVIQPTLIALAIAYAAWLRSVGIEPDAVVGHSLGEVGAAAIAGVIDLPSAMRIICRRSALMQRTSGQGAMAVIELPEAEVQARIAPHASTVSVAVTNSPRSTVISGAPEVVKQILDGLERDGVFCRLVKVDVASHSPQMEPLVPELVAAAAGAMPTAGRVAMYSTVFARRAVGEEFAPGYWGLNLRQPVQFSRTVTAMLADGITAFVELGPHPVLTQAISQTAAAGNVDVVAVACGRRETADVTTAYAAVAALWARGVTIPWTRLMPWGGPRVSLPFYPWQRERYWADAADLASADAGVSRRARLDERLRRALHSLQWQPLSPAAAAGAGAPARWIVVGPSGTARDAIAAAMHGALHAAVTTDSMEEAGRIVQSDASATWGVVVLPPADDSAAFLPVTALKALQAASPAPARVWWLTAGAHVVAGSTAVTAAAGAARAAAWGTVRVLAEEYPEWWGGLVDLDPAVPASVQADALRAHLISGDDESQVALRGGVRQVLRLVESPDASRRQSAPFSWRHDAAYLITGGFGGVSMQLAQAMVRAGARRLVLLGRTALPPRSEWGTIDPASPAGTRVAAVRALEHAGAAVHVLQADIANEASVRAALDGYRAEGWPEIDGVIHNAAVLGNKLARDLTPVQFDAVLAPKLTGAVILDRLLPSLALFVVSSSISAFWAPPGMANYAAANAGLDAVVAARRARGQHGISIAWCPWDDVGMHGADNMARNFDELARVGVGSISATEGVALFASLLTCADASICVLPMDWTVYRGARRGRDLPLFRAIPDAAPQADDAGGGDSVLLTLRAAGAVDRRTQLLALVRSVVATVVRRPAAQLDARQPFGSIGVDSLLALEIRTRLETALERPLTATLAWNYPTVDALATYLDGVLFPAAAPAPVAVAAPAVEPVAEFSEIAALSDADALRALRRRR